MSTKAKWFNFSDIDNHAKASYKHLYELLPKKGYMEWSKCQSSNPFVNPDEMSLDDPDQVPGPYLRLNIGHLNASDTESHIDRKVYAHGTVSSEGYPRIRFTPQVASDSAGVQSGKVVWYKPFDKLDAPSKCSTTRRSWFKVVSLYYMLAHGEVPQVRMNETWFHATLKAVCRELYSQEQVTQPSNALGNAKRPREDDDVPSPARAVKSMSMSSHAEAV
jgi:hypothetical protein